MSRPTIYILRKLDPYLALATEEWCLEHPTHATGVVLLLWCSRPAIVIGRNQNPWLECNPGVMRTEDVLLVRRPSGGGAVYHDDGNLNIAFINRRATFDADANLKLIQRALERLGIATVRTRRHDLTVDGRKISGSAFCYRHNHILHHATLLIRSNLERLHRCLHPALPMIETRAIRSTASPVANLAEYIPNLTIQQAIETLSEIVSSAATDNSGHFADSSTTHPAIPPADPLAEQPVAEQPVAHAAIAAAAARLRNWEWLYSKTPAFRLTLQHSFDWGRAHAHIQVKHAAIESIQIELATLPSATRQEIEARLIGRHLPLLAETGVTAPKTIIPQVHDPRAAEIEAWILSSFG